jgi:SAM-dependent methyltransferase/uncharacterized protein YbaR (Trm112 family)
MGYAASARMRGSISARTSPLLSLLRCLECGSPLREVGLDEPGVYPELGPDGRLECTECDETYPVVGGTPRMLRLARLAQTWVDYPEAAQALGANGAAGPARAASDVRSRTAESFAYEWERFGVLREEWLKNFLDYMQPHEGGDFKDRLVLDVGTGSGRHSFQAAEFGAQVVAVDLGRSIDVARRNLEPDVLTVQADAEDLPFERDRFDFVLSIGVLHHLPDPERAFRYLIDFVRPGGYIKIYLYWVPPRRLHQRVLSAVNAVRRVTTRMPYRLLHALCYPLAAALYVGCVTPYRLMRRRPALARLADVFPLKAYADYPFAVLLNDQFDRFSAPLEQRYTDTEVRRWLEDAGLEDPVVLPNNGWVATGRRPAPDAS